MLPVAWSGPHGVLMEGLDGPTPDESFVVPAHLTGLDVDKELKACVDHGRCPVRSAADNDMLTPVRVTPGKVGAGVAGLD